MLILRRLHVLRNLVALQRHPLLSRPTYVTQTNLALWILHSSLYRLSQYHLRAQPGLCIFDTSAPTPHFFGMTDFHQRGKMDCSLPFFCFQDDLPFCFLLWPCFVHCCFCIQNFHRLGKRSALVHKIIMTQWVEPLLSYVIFMIFRWSRFQTLSRGFMRFYDACMLWVLEFVGFAQGFPVLERLQLTRHSGFHSKFQLFRTLHHPDQKKRCLSTFSLSRSSVSRCPLFISLSCSWHGGPNFGLQMIKPRGCCKPRR